MRLLFTFIAIYSLACIPIKAQQVGASAGTYTLKIGEQTDITLTAKPLKGDRILWPVLSDSLGPHFDIVTKSPADTLRDSISGLESYRQKIRITSFDTGLFTLPVFSFTFVKPGGDSISIISDALSIEVKAVAVDTTQAIKDIKGIQEVPYELTEFIPWLLGGLAIAALIVAGIYIWLRRRKVIQPTLPAKPNIPPWDKAYAALQKLSEERLWQQGKEKVYHSNLSGILRIYIEEQFGMPALESTSDEIIRMCERHAELSAFQSQLRQILQIADLVKFAKANPLPAEHERSLVLAFEFLNGSKPDNIGKEVNHV